MVWTMLHEFKLPDIGEGLTEAEIVSWFVDEGEAIAVADLVVEVETAKTTVEIPSPHAGVLSKRFGEEGDTVEVGAVLFVVETADAPTSESDSMPEPATPAPDPEPSTAASVAPELRAGERSTGVRAVPAVRKLAKDLGVELATVVGTGPNGAITRDDVTTAASGPESDTMVPLSSVRRAIAANMTESWTTIPHVTVQAEVRAEALLAALGNGTPIEASVATAVLPLLVEFPAFNSRYEDDGILHRSIHNLGFAVDTDAGLLVAVVKDADTLDQADLATEINRVQGAARSGNLTPRRGDRANLHHLEHRGSRRRPRDAHHPYGDLGYRIDRSGDRAAHRGSRNDRGRHDRAHRSVVRPPDHRRRPRPTIPIRPRHRPRNAPLCELARGVSGANTFSPRAPKPRGS